MRIILAAVLVVATLLVAGCTSGTQVPDVGGLPLAKGSQIVLRTKTCDPGANAYCGDELVIVNPGFDSSLSFLNREVGILHRRGWTGQYAPNGSEHSDDSPGHKLRVIFSTAEGDLTGIDLGWIARPHRVSVALAHAMLRNQPTLSVLLMDGAS